MNKEPLIRVIKDDERSFIQKALIRAVAVILALLASALFINLVTKLNPIAVFQSMFKGAFGTSRRTWVTVRDAAFLLIIAVGLAPSFKMKFWNTGAEGQILIGGLTTAALMMYLGGKMPNFLLLVLMMLCSITAGALWGFLPAYFKAKYRTNETLFTLMMNYVAIQLVEFFVDVWDKKESHSVGIINLNTRAGWFPEIFGQQYMLNVILVAIVTAFIYIYLKYTKHGYEIAVTGESENTARYAGINVFRVIIRTMLLSAGICGMAGFIAVSGVSHTISKITAGGKGFTAIIVAWLAKLNSAVMIVFSLFLSFLDKGAIQIVSDFGLNSYASHIVTGILLFFILGSEFFVSYRLVFRHKEER